MCGLFGGCGPSLSDKDREAVKALGELSKHRGKDSTGLFAAFHHTSGKSKGFKFKMHKDVLESPEFMASKPVKSIMASEPFILGGHTRSATHGSIKVSNAHPFSVGHYIGTHNGVINDLHDRVNDKTDSEVLFTNMMNDGVNKGIRSGLTKGDMALVFINKSNSTLNYYRNEGRPLFIGLEKKKKKFFWASQKDFLEFIEKQRLIEFSEIYSVAPYMLHSVNLKTLAVSISAIYPPVQPKTTFYPPQRTSVPSVGKPINQPLLDWMKKQGVQSSTGTAPTARTAQCAYSRKVTTIEGRPAVIIPAAETDETKTTTVWYKGYDEILSTQGAANQLLKGFGCDCCGKKHKSMFDPVYWLSSKAWVCASCMYDEEAQKICYEGISFTTGGFCNKNGVLKTSKNTLPF